MYALSIKQPWAWLICAGFKDVENRDWPTKFRGRIYVHAGKVFDYKSWCDIASGLVPGADKCQLSVHERFYAHNGDHLLGAIIGEVDIVNCLEYWSATKNKSPWFVGRYGFFLANPVLYEKPIPYKGQLGFFEVTL